jgi:hypothetical protein
MNGTCTKLVKEEEYLSTLQHINNEPFISRPVYDASQYFHDDCFKNDFSYKVEGNCIVENEFQNIHQAFTPIDIMSGNLHVDLGSQIELKEYLQNVTVQKKIEDEHNLESLDNDFDNRHIFEPISIDFLNVKSMYDEYGYSYVEYCKDILLQFTLVDETIVQNIFDDQVAYEEAKNSLLFSKVYNSPNYDDFDEYGDSDFQGSSTLVSIKNDLVHTHLKMLLIITIVKNFLFKMLMTRINIKKQSFSVDTSIEK